MRFLAIFVLMASIRPALPQQQNQEESAPADEEQPIWLQNRNQLDIFDVPPEQRVPPLERAARQIDRIIQRDQRIVVEGLDPVGSMDLQIQGREEAHMRQQVRIDALKAAAGQLYFADYYLLGRDLLEPYLKRNQDRFILRTRELSRDLIPDGQTRIRFRVSVDQETMYEDLAEKRFIARPNLRPIIAVYLEEIVDGQSTERIQARQQIETVLRDNLFRVRSESMRQPPLNLNLGTSPDMLKTARFEAQRNNIDVLLSGTFNVQTIKETPIFYDDYSFQKATLHLKAYRVDTGEVFAEIRQDVSTVDPETRQARTKALQSAVEQTTQELGQQLRESWENTMLMAKHHRLMIRPVPPDQKDMVTNYLKTLSPKVRIYEKSYYGGVLVLNLVVPTETTASLETFLREARKPQFKVRRIDDRRLALELL